MSDFNLRPTMESLPILELLPPTPSGSADVKHYLSGKAFHVNWESHVLTSLTPQSGAPSPNFWIAPGLIDIQVNGYAGIDFQKDPTPSSIQDLHKVVQALRNDGCHRILLTIITAEWPTLLKRVAAYRKLIQSDAMLHQAIPGWHIEGPFISGEPGFVGAHHAPWTCNPSPEHIRQLKNVVQQDPLLLTLAPERSGSAASIAEAVKCGFQVSFGHTNATQDQIREGIRAGAQAHTHLGNGCTKTLDRGDNILWRIMDEPSLTCGIIPDTLHVTAPLFRLMHRAISPDKIYWTTDAMAAAGAPPGKYSIGRLEAEVGADKIVRNIETGGFAGSALEPIEGIRRGSQMLKKRWQEVWDFFSSHPAKLMGLPSELRPGSPAGFCLLKEVAR